MSDIKAYRMKLQIDHVCCVCGISLAENTIGILGAASIDLGSILTTQSIVWRG